MTTLCVETPPPAPSSSDLPELHPRLFPSTIPAVISQARFAKSILRQPRAERPRPPALAPRQYQSVPVSREASQSH
ncbi:hypothetical protein AV530_004814 [Patagioenas fasciata monilis]|uniref:Uncharacterized protein n=1 Tax=Patagioenas fasciata monilis TaxID=372326 RepID=A0A1V4KE68_PATFA|nr:hypothetical protein AV530_004814 [Patagioenas fasciata monilis]